MIIAQPARVGRWVDTSFKLTRHVAEAVKALGYEGIGRYVPLPGNSSAGDIDAPELEMICDVDLQVTLFQHVRGTKANPLWKPSLCSAIEDATTACGAAKNAGVPDSVTIYQDLEAVDDTTMNTMIYTERWGQYTTKGSYGAGLYVGYSARLSPEELYALPDVHTYAADWGPRQVAVRGVSYRQIYAHPVIAGVNFDEAFVSVDALGGLPIVCGLAA